MRPSAVHQMNCAPSLERGVVKCAEGSCMVKSATPMCWCGRWKNGCAMAQGRGRGWVTAEYGMLPAPRWNMPAAGFRRQTERPYRRNPAPDRPPLRATPPQALGERQITVGAT